MPVTVWTFPTRIVFGENAAHSLADEVHALGAKSALFVSDPGVRDAGLLEPLDQVLRKAGIGSARFCDLSTNPTETELQAATEAYRAAGADIVIGVGGGAPLDVAKLVRLTSTQPLPLAEYDDAKGGADKVTGTLPPMVAIPTTAGTGSEVGRSGVVTLSSTGKKTVFFHPKLMPNVAILDPVLTVSLPPRVTAATGFDALSHCVEAYCAQGLHPMADAIALKGITLISKNLQRAVEDGHDLQARGCMLQAAMMGAVAFQKGLGVCHSLAHPLGAKFDMHHGLANAMCLPATLDFNRTAVTTRIALIGARLGARGDDDETLAFECAGAVRKLRADVKLPDGLAQLGVAEEHLDELSLLAFEDGCHALNPRACTRDDMLSLYKASM